MVKVPITLACDWLGRPEIEATKTGSSYPGSSKIASIGDARAWASRYR